MKKQTAVEWLLHKLIERKLITLDKDSTIIFHKDFSTPYDLIVHQAKEMEKEQIIAAHDAARDDHYQMYFSEEYYTKTYGGDK